MRGVQELCDRYGIKKAAFSLFVKSHRDEIDPDRTHITRDGKNMFFDEFSVIQMDKIRGYTDLHRVVYAKDTSYEMITVLRENAALKEEIIRQLQENNKIREELSEEKQKNIVLLAANQNYILQLEGADQRPSTPTSPAMAWRNWRNRHKRY